MPIIDVYATSGTFADPKALARQLAATLMKIEVVPDIPMFRKNTAALSTLSRTDEAIDGGWGLAGQANTNAELVAAARAQLAELQRANSARR